MGILDSNIHMNGAGKTYQAFLNLADAAEQKGGKICDRTVRLVKASDGLATTTFNGTKGARVAQINDAREIFLYSRAQEFFRFVAKINSMITEKDEQDAIEGSEEYSEFVNTAQTSSNKGGANQVKELLASAQHWSSANSCIMQLRANSEA